MSTTTIFSGGFCCRKYNPLLSFYRKSWTAFQKDRDNLRELKKYQRRIGNYHVLIIDEWLSNKLTEKDSKWIYELMEQRSGNNPTILIGQYKSDEWFERLGGGTLADSIMDRIIHNSYPISTK